MGTKRLPFLLVLLGAFVVMPTRAEEQIVGSWYREPCGQPDANGTVFYDVSVFDGRWPTEEEFRQAYTEHCEVQVRNVPVDWGKVQELDTFWDAAIRINNPNDLYIECNASDVSECRAGCQSPKSDVCPLACELEGVKCVKIMRTGETVVTPHCRCLWRRNLGGIS